VERGASLERPTGKLDAATPNLQLYYRRCDTPVAYRPLTTSHSNHFVDNNNPRSERGITRAAPSPMPMPRVGHVVVDVLKTCSCRRLPTTDSNRPLTVEVNATAGPPATTRHVLKIGAYETHGPTIVRIMDRRPA
jgi:hypothetical protein